MIPKVIVERPCRACAGLGFRVTLRVSRLGIPANGECAHCDGSGKEYVVTLYEGVAEAIIKVPA